MFSPLRNRFGIPGAISVIALVFAMLGGAYAASNDSGGGKAAASAKKAKKGPRGPRGKAGPPGPAGPQGPAGANGKDGANGSNGLEGEKGEDGDDGTNGTNGKSVENSAEPAGTNCTEGGSKFVVGTGAPTYACNGLKGAKGDPGDPWTVGGTLPSGKTETGSFVLGPVMAGAIPESVEEFTAAPISFTVPLAADIPASNVHYLPFAAAATTECPGSPEDPKALAGHLCVYSAREPAGGWVIGPKIEKAGAFGEGASKAGAFLLAISATPKTQSIGTWAVTAP